MSDAPGVAVDAARENGRPPRDDLVRAVRSSGALRAATPAAPAEGEASANPNGMPTLYGYFTRFGEWTEIDSWYEGNFLERIAAGAFKKTFREQAPKVLFQHGMDGMVGDKPLGPPEVLREEADGPYYEVPLLDTSYNRDLVPGLEAGLYGASFRFSVMREEWVDDPGVSEYNPKGLPERTIKEVRCSEFGPVTFPAYPGATAAVRSMTDEWLAARMTSQPDRLRSILEFLERRDARPELHQSASPEQGEADTSQEVERMASDDKAAEAVIEQAEAEAPGGTPTPSRGDAAPGGRPTPLYTGRTEGLAAPGASPTPLYTGHRKRKEWEL